jgi:hypothetical protein
MIEAWVLIFDNSVAEITFDHILTWNV